MPALHRRYVESMVSSIAVFFWGGGVNSSSAAADTHAHELMHLLRHLLLQVSMFGDCVLHGAWGPLAAAAAAASTVSATFALIPTL